MKTKFFLSALITLLLASCTIQKRHHSFGVYVERWRGNNVSVLASKYPADSSKTAEHHVHPDFARPDLNELDFLQPTHEDFVLDQNQKAIDPISENSIAQSEFGPVNELTYRLNKNYTRKSNLIAEKQAADDSEQKNGTSLVTLVSILMAVSVVGLMQLFRKILLKFTRWAKANPRKTQAMIAGIQVTLLATGILSGNNLKQLGYEISDSVFYVFGALTLLGFLVIPFRAKESDIALPKTVFRARLAFLVISISSLMLMVGFGNRVTEKDQGTVLANAVEQIDHSMFSFFGDDQFNKPAADYDHENKYKQNGRIAVGAGSIILGIFLILLLLIAMCAGICLVIFSFAGVFAGGAAILAVIGGLAITAMSVIGIVASTKLFKDKDKHKPPSLDDRDELI